MKVSEILKAKGNEVSIVRADLTIGGLATKLNEARVGAMLVMGEGGEIVGIVSERDIVRAMAELGAGVANRRVGQIMTTAIVSCTPDAKVSDIARTMTNRRIRHMPVMEGTALVGIVSIGDVLKSRLDEMELEANVLRDVAIAAR
ncbi:MAG: CBS domain-containing protein [Hyphomicrobiaceae bacterium]|nr:CBS domain-containing protein [Hyphomicrobiaceae bacterium]